MIVSVNTLSQWKKEMKRGWNLEFIFIYPGIEFFSTFSFSIDFLLQVAWF